MTALAYTPTEQPCQVCDRPCWSLDELGRPVHGCCLIEIRWATHEHRPDCEACILAESERRRWERGRGKPKTKARNLS